MTSDSVLYEIYVLTFLRNFPDCLAGICHSAAEWGIEEEGAGEKAFYNFLSEHLQIFFPAQHVCFGGRRRPGHSDCCLKWNSNQYKGWLSRQPLTCRCAGQKRAAWLNKWKPGYECAALKSEGQSYLYKHVLMYIHKIKWEMMRFLDKEVSNLKTGTVLKRTCIRRPNLGIKIWHLQKFFL